jgi:hypothetical protein
VIKHQTRTASRDIEIANKEVQISFAAEVDRQQNEET